MKESYDEGKTRHIGLESCGYSSNAVSEALTEEDAGGVLSHEIALTLDCRWCPLNQKATRDISLQRKNVRVHVVRGLQHALKPTTRNPGEPTVWPRWQRGRIGKSKDAIR